MVIILARLGGGLGKVTQQGRRAVVLVQGLGRSGFGEFLSSVGSDGIRCE